MPKLYEVEHPYYATEGSYFDNGWHHCDESWAEFLENMGDADMDQNYLYRFDWRVGEDWGIPEGEAELLLFYILQRKAATMSRSVKVTPDQEPEIREWLAKRWEHTKTMWTPLSEA